MSKSVEHFIDAYTSMLRSTTRIRTQIATYNGVDFTGLRLLAHLIANGPSRPSDLAEELVVDPAIITRQSQVLLESGYVTRELNPADARATLLVVTELGKALSKSHADIRSEFFNEVFAGWSQSEIDSFANSIEVFTKTLNERSKDAIQRMKANQEK